MFELAVFKINQLVGTAAYSLCHVSHFLRTTKHTTQHNTHNKWISITWCVWYENKCKPLIMQCAFMLKLNKDNSNRCSNLQTPVGVRWKFPHVKGGIDQDATSDDSFGLIFPFSLPTPRTGKWHGSAKNSLTYKTLHHKNVSHDRANPYECSGPCLVPCDSVNYITSAGTAKTKAGKRPLTPSRLAEGKKKTLPVMFYYFRGFLHQPDAWVCRLSLCVSWTPARERFPWKINTLTGPKKFRLAPVPFAVPLVCCLPGVISTVYIIIKLTHHPYSSISMAS